MKSANVNPLNLSGKNLWLSDKYKFQWKASLGYTNVSKEETLGYTIQF